jgi:hypothetical protein
MQHPKHIARIDKIGDRIPKRVAPSTVAPVGEYPRIIGPVCHIGEDALVDDKGMLARLLARLADYIRQHAC